MAADDILSQIGLHWPNETFTIEKDDFCVMRLS